MPINESQLTVIKITTRAALSAMDRSSYRAGTLALVVENGVYYTLLDSAPLPVDGVTVLATQPGVWYACLASVPALGAAQLAADITAAGTRIPITSTETVLDSGGTNPVQGAVGGATTTDGATFVTLFSFTPPANSGDDWSVSLIGIDVTGAPPISGDFSRSDIQFSSTRIASAAPTLFPSVPAVANTQSSGGGSTYAVQVVVSTNTLLVQVRGAAAKTVHWRGVAQRMPVS
jgi:hypothetical protein